MTTLVDKYDVQKSCLSFVEINLYFGLGDVWRITGLPIDGKVIVVKDVNRRALCEGFLSMDSCVSDHTSGISLVCLRIYINYLKDHALEGQDLSSTFTH